MKTVLLMILAASGAAAQSAHPLEALTGLARKGPGAPGLAEAVDKTLS